MRPKIVAVGTIGYDDIKTSEGNVSGVLGGCLVHFSLTAGLFTKVSAVGVVGGDFNEKDIAFMRSRGVDTSAVRRARGKTFRWHANYKKPSGDPHATAFLNVIENFDPLKTMPSADGKVLFLANMPPKTQLRALEGARGSRLSACDTMISWMKQNRRDFLKTFGQVLRKMDIVFINKYEIRCFMSADNLIQAGREIIKKGPSVVVIKMDEGGAMLVTAKDVISLPAYPCAKVADMTGAGDTFAGGFMGYLSGAKCWRDTKELKRALGWGIVCASFNIEDFGLKRISSISRADLRARMKKYSAMLSV